MRATRCIYIASVEVAKAPRSGVDSLGVDTQGHDMHGFLGVVGRGALWNSFVISWTGCCGTASLPASAGRGRSLVQPDSPVRPIGTGRGYSPSRRGPRTEKIRPKYQKYSAEMRCHGIPAPAAGLLE